MIIVRHKIVLFCLRLGVPVSNLSVIMGRFLRFYELCYFCLVFVVLSCAYVCWCLEVACCVCVWGGGGGGWHLDSRLWCLIIKLSLSHWYPGSGVVLDRIDS